MPFGFSAQTALGSIRGSALFQEMRPSLLQIFGPRSLLVALISIEIGYSTASVSLDTTSKDCHWFIPVSCDVFIHVVIERRARSKSWVTRHNTPHHDKARSVWLLFKMTESDIAKITEPGSLVLKPAGGRRAEYSARSHCSASIYVYLAVLSICHTALLITAAVLCHALAFYPSFQKYRPCTVVIMFSLQHFLLLLLFTLTSVLAAECDCYETDAGDIFTSYNFIDFRGGNPQGFEEIFDKLDTDYKIQEVYNRMDPKNVVIRNAILAPKAHPRLFLSFMILLA